MHIHGTLLTPHSHLTKQIHPQSVRDTTTGMLHTDSNTPGTQSEWENHSAARKNRSGLQGVLPIAPFISLLQIETPPSRSPDRRRTIPAPALDVLVREDFRISTHPYMPWTRMGQDVKQCYNFLFFKSKDKEGRQIQFSCCCIHTRWLPSFRFLLR